MTTGEQSEQTSVEEVTEEIEEIKEALETEQVWFQFAPCTEPVIADSTETNEQESATVSTESVCSDRVSIYNLMVSHKLRIRYKLRDDQDNSYWVEEPLP